MMQYKEAFMSTAMITRNVVCRRREPPRLPILHTTDKSRVGLRGSMI